MNEVYGFKEEVIKKYSKTVYNLFQELFHCLPLAHLIDEQILVVHGGLPLKDGVSLTEIEEILRFKEPPEKSVMFDLLWSDPSPNQGHSPNPRGVSTAFGPDITHAFTKKNNLKYIIRSHEYQIEGYKLQHDEKCITIFSAPNYCEMPNQGAIIRLNKNLIPEFIKFSASPHP
uniref:Serine/threonine-protein phosphatase 5 (Trinotate prediction) n=1 Tax=Myxobolus squamalis TaxID=59785 RepID=A0A6B2G461_MYXSQ